MRFLSCALLVIPLALPCGGVEPEGRRDLGRAVLTFYWIVDESSSRYAGDRTATLRDRRGKVIAMTTPRFRKELLLEGTGWLRDGRTVAVDRKIGGEYRFRVTRSRYGRTASGCRPDPFRTVAVDPRFVPLGSELYIPQLEGTVLPDGSVHDGRFIASDRGGFRGAHVDIFVGVGSKGTRAFARKGYPSRSRVRVFVEPTKPRRCR